MRRLAGVVVLVTAWGMALAQQRPFPASRDAQKPATKAEVEKLREEVAELRAEIKALRDLIVKLGEGADDVEAAGARVADPAAIAKAIKEERLAVGMTLDEANRALKVKPKLLGEQGDVKEYEWQIWWRLGPGADAQGAPVANDKFLHHTFRANVIDGCIDSYDRTDYLDLPK
jgi:hypothetical protein